jgi:putative tricarboxylic transport membrane protein
MLRRRRCSLLLAAIFITATPLHAQPWTPIRTIEIIVSSGAGGAADREARELQKHLQMLRGMPPVTVNNRPGGGGAIAWSALNQHQGDAHWIATMNVALLTNHILGASQLHYRDLTPLAMLMREYVAVWTHAASPIKSVRDLLARLKANPAAVSFGLSPALGNQNHIVLGMLAKAAGIDPRALKIVVYSAGGSGITAALGGHVDVWAGSLAGAIPLAQSGKVNVIGVSADKRQPGKAMALPTFHEQGVDAVYAGYRGAIGPAGLSAAQRAYWDEVFAKIVDTPEWKATLLEHAWESAYRNSAETREYLDEAYVTLQKSLAALGLTRQSR